MRQMKKKPKIFSHGMDQYSDWYNTWQNKLKLLWDMHPHPQELPV
jgi:hypothetical protein